MNKILRNPKLAKKLLIGPVAVSLFLLLLAAGTYHGMTSQNWRPWTTFVGPSGQELDKLLQQNGLLRSDIYITNVIKEQPPNNNIDVFINLDKSKATVSPKAEMYMELLTEELSQWSANVIMPMGNTALWTLTTLNGILKWRGSVLESTRFPGRKIIPTIHPRAVLPPTGVYLWRYLIGFDLRKAKLESAFPEIRRLQDSMSVALNFAETMATLEFIKANSSIIDIDIEVMREQVSCFGISWEDEISPHAISIPFIGPDGNYFAPDQEAQIWLALTELLENPHVVKRGQNILFDCFFLLQKHGIRTTNILSSSPRRMSRRASMKTRPSSVSSLSQFGSHE